MVQERVAEQADEDFVSATVLRMRLVAKFRLISCRDRAGPVTDQRRWPCRSD